MTWAWRDGAFGEPAVAPDCRAFTHGYGVFETMLGHDGKLVAVDLHWRRLAEGCRRLGLRLPSEGLAGAIESKLGNGRQRVRLQVSEGGLVTVTVSDAGPMPEGVKVVSAPWVRNERSPLAGIKCCSYAENLVALAWARGQGANELLFPNTRGELCEAAMANVFLVENGELWTPSLESGCLPGTARERVIGLARELGIGLREEAIPMEHVDDADELFLTSAVNGVVPVVAAGERTLGVGAMSERLRRMFAELGIG